MVHGLSDRRNQSPGSCASVRSPGQAHFVLFDRPGAQSTIVIRRLSVWNRPSPVGSSVRELTT
jgi:hypothetical protein